METAVQCANRTPELEKNMDQARAFLTVDSHYFGRKPLKISPRPASRFREEWELFKEDFFKTLAPGLLLLFYMLGILYLVYRVLKPHG